MKEITAEELELLQKANIDFNKAKIVLADIGENLSAAHYQLAMQ